ncbi:uncharacterized protein FTJAE_6915 [Fusarium tjaetaba]|uniref:Uncharacterized protein n=1 Tax=Fusarium tjaetaba TaxID=1567544 RepID=A0A8H5RIU0_9HYPO|nr:uncharacterized protein FTJAE_6915 [Fusarium tjaetaba]KAF5633929.1 hypothetical protein FTJAE_6915 [Fusarium tjaetaba]
MTRNSSIGNILAPGDAAQLIKLDLVNLPNPPNGSIQIHKRRLNRTSDAVHKNIPLNANVESRPDAFATIPEKLISKATIEYVGFNSDKATDIWSCWVNWPSGSMIREIDPRDSTTTLEVSFIYWVKSHTGNPLVYDVWEDDNSAWFRHMEQCGIATELQQSIMDPRFKDMRLTDTCIGWLRNTMELRYEWLKEIQRTSSEREKALVHQGTSTRSKKQSGLASRGLHKLAGPLSIRGCTVLYKAIDEARTNGLFDHEGNLDRIQLLSTPPSTDFSRTKSMYYFTPDYSLARKQAAWIKQRGIPAVIVQIAVSDIVITSMDPDDVQCAFWPNSNWRELVWHCRTKMRLPEEFSETYGKAILIIGTIANRPDLYYQQRSPADLTSEDCVVMVRGPNNGGYREAVQYVFSSDDEGETFLEDQARHTMKIFHFGTRELEA